ncbi:murein DD-endopeptidase MepM [Mergibacter septicus]|uniref:Murein DD-endopeptidase MepM n=1 Tax=Mergibacter septicus TaxID=221402 RepID=A0A8D4LLZ4_9PAST|nr:murein DD-endopeptidase MepM [Mergibacter septicus]AWX15172.1 murein DD-endopeptidase MepM [Mergibacter septicus]QDJ14426.1 murein DD-endopeptidase MepM [Mergibacter septicus]UTU48136.1 murein DD-endopeptidase MepM [Mergibacter septicus]WMR96247.1 murein DD-endopeptidase MepM [Mergibacter septicus]
MKHIKLARERLKQLKHQARIKSVTLLFLLTLVIFAVLYPFIQHHQSNTVSNNQGTPISQSYNDGIASSDNNDPNPTSYDEDIDTDFHDDEANLPEDAKDAINDLLNAAEQAIRIKNQFNATVSKGDTLADILSSSGLEADTVHELLQVDKSLSNLQPGQQFYWTIDKNGNLQYLDWQISQKEEYIFQRQADGKFTKEMISKKGIWKEEILTGEINSSLYVALKNLGLTARQIKQLSSALQWQVEITRLKKGDRFSLLISREYIDGKLTGQGNVLAIHIITGKKSYYAIQANNGSYYNLHGETIGTGFARYPTLRPYRISSPFNPKRKHPITGRISPHKGVDFAMPIGTPIIAPSDGTVSRISYQKAGAGHYVVLRHGREYETIYMHLSKPLVKIGQKVKKGQRIALSGNTGRSTGPHLHYELRINGVSVNPMTVKLPSTNNTLNSKERKDFLQRAKELQTKLQII